MSLIYNKFDFLLHRKLYNHRHPSVQYCVLPQNPTTLYNFPVFFWMHIACWGLECSMYQFLFSWVVTWGQGFSIFSRPGATFTLSYQTVSHRMKGEFIEIT
jgi:hypothetical protein